MATIGAPVSSPSFDEMGQRRASRPSKASAAPMKTWPGKRLARSQAVSAKSDLGA